jgi:hypothetical protein
MSNPEIDKFYNPYERGNYELTSKQNSDRFIEKQEPIHRSLLSEYPVGDQRDCLHNEKNA